jgi:hypothetical protein
MDAQTVDLTRRRAAQRVILRRRPPGERVIGQGLDGTDVTVKEAGEFFPAESLGDFLDDQLVVRAQWRGPFTGVLADVLEAARVTASAAVDALAAAKRLDAMNQWLLYTDLRQLRDEANLPDARDLMQALIRAWERTRGLRTAPPDAAEMGEARDPRPLSRDVPTQGAAGVAVW